MADDAPGQLKPIIYYADLRFVHPLQNPDGVDGEWRYSSDRLFYRAFTFDMLIQGLILDGVL